MKINKPNKNIYLIIQRLKKLYPNPRTELKFSNPLELLIATILSAQCTDARVNIVTPMLFDKYKSANDFAKANLTELEQDIKSTGFYRMKAKNIQAVCKAIIEKYNGNVPNTMEDLLSLPGVGRKTANCVLGGAFGIQSGIVVDTHVIRLSNRLGLTKNSVPEKIEEDLMKIVPKNQWYQFSNLLILHGRKICKSRNPKCDDCPLLSICPSAKPIKIIK